MIHRETLSNGMTLAVEPMPEVRSVSLGLWLRRGSRHETLPLNGASHFLEHLVFKGTATRSARDIALAIDSIGGHIDAFTSKEYTCFYAKVLDEHFEGALDLLTDILRNPRFDPEDIERERQVIFEEIRMVNDSPDEKLFDLFLERFWPGHPLGRPIQGNEASVEALSRNRIVRFFRRSYVPANLVVAVAGHVPGRRTLTRLRRAFGDLPRSPSGRGVSAPRPRPARFFERRDDMEQLHLCLGLPGLPETHRARYTMHVLNAILGATMSGRLFQRIREQHGLVYSVYSAGHSFSDTGAFMVYAATRPGRGNDVLRLTVEELRRIAAEKPTDEEMEVARNHIKGSLLLSLESTNARMSNLARHVILRKPVQEVDGILKAIDRVSARAVRDLAARLFSGRRPALGALGPANGLARASRNLVL